MFVFVFVIDMCSVKIARNKCLCHKTMNGVLFNTFIFMQMHEQITACDW